MGKEKVSEFLKLKIGFFILFNIDSLGYVKNIQRASLKFPTQIDDTIKGKIRDYLIDNKSRFFICYDIRPERDTCKMYKIISEEYRITHSQPHAFGGFPVGELFYPDYQRYLDANTENPLTVFEYLQEEIKKYLPEK